MESVIIWSAAIICITLITLPYILKFQRQRKIDLDRRDEAVSLGIDKPVAQYPVIDAMRCMGCGSCVRACTQGDVLGIVFGTSTIINGFKCIGCGRCADFCPVSGIIIGMGDLRNRDDIPMMNQFNETNIPRLFIAGELGGLSLIKNAIIQGSMVVQKIAQNPERSTHEKIKDLIIVGAGPAGLSAALTAIKYKLSYVVLDQQCAGGTILQYPRKKIVMLDPVEIPLYGWLKKYEYTKEELLDVWNKIVVHFKVNMKSGDKLINVIRENGIFQVTTQNGVYHSRNLILALGRRGTPRKLGVPGENLSKVMYQLIDAESYQNNRILVVGGGDSAVEATIALAEQRDNFVTLSYRKNKFFRIKKKNLERINKLIANKKVRCIFNSNVIEIRQKSVHLKINEKAYEIANDYVFIFAGGVPPFDLLKQIGIKFGGKSNNSNRLFNEMPQLQLEKKAGLLKKPDLKT